MSHGEGAGGSEGCKEGMLLGIWEGDELERLGRDLYVGGRGKRSEGAPRSLSAPPWEGGEDGELGGEYACSH